MILNPIIDHKDRNCNSQALLKIDEKWESCREVDFDTSPLAVVHIILYMMSLILKRTLAIIHVDETRLWLRKYLQQWEESIIGLSDIQLDLRFISLGTRQGQFWEI